MSDARSRWPVTVLALAASTAALGADAGAAQRSLSWAKDLRPALAASVCVQSWERDGKTFFGPQLGLPPDCPGEPPADPVVRDAVKLFVDIGMPLQWLQIDLFERIQPIRTAADPARRGEYQERFREAWLSHPGLQKRFMPQLHALLRTANVACPDCPGPREAASTRSVTLDELMPYAVAYVWPDGIGDNDMEVRLHICVGANGVSRLTDPDLDLADSAMKGVFMNKAATARVGPVLTEALKDDSYHEASTKEAKLEFLRKFLRTRLTNDREFRLAVAKQLTEKAGELKVVCADCAKEGPKPAPAAAPAKE